MYTTYMGSESDTVLLVCPLFPAKPHLTQTLVPPTTSRIKVTRTNVVSIQGLNNDITLSPTAYRSPVIGVSLARTVVREHFHLHTFRELKAQRILR
jgi:hypothetical protein